MNKWQYKYSFFSGILLVLSYISKIVTTNVADITLLVVLFPYLLIVSYTVGLYLGFMKYSILNEKPHIFWATTTLIVFIVLRFITESLCVINVLQLGNIMLIVSNYSLAFGLLIWGVFIFDQKKIYGKSTFLQGLLACLLSFSIFVPYNAMVFLLQPIIYIAFFISCTYLVNKNENKLKPKKRIRESRLLRNDLL